MMGFIKHWRGHLHEDSGEFDDSMLLQEVTLDEYLAQQYPPHLLQKFPEQARADRDVERDEIQAATQPGDTLWLWRRGASPSEAGGLAVKRAGKVVRVWLVWREN
jgi:hypothetical protein